MLAGNKGFGVTTEQLDTTLADYDKADADVLRWWLDQAKDRNWKLTDLSRHTGVSTTVLSRVYRGIYNADTTKVMVRLATAKATFNESVENPDFISTSLSRHMFAMFDKTRALRNITIAWGPMGIGKTTIEKEYTRLHNHGQTYYHRCPGHGTTLCQFVTSLARSMRISTNGRSADTMRSDISQYLSRGNRLLIIDELHEVFRTCTARDIVRICEWLRELQGDDLFGLVLTGTELLKHEFSGGKYSDILAQLVDRGTLQIPLSGKPTKKDVLAFLRHYGLTFPEAGTTEHQLLNDILTAHGLRKLTLHLRDGVAYSLRKDEAFTWDHFVAAHSAIQTLTKKR